MAVAGAQQSVICGTPCPERWIASELRIAEPSDDILHKGINRVGGRRDACGGDSGLKLRRHLLGFIDRYRLNRAHAPVWSPDSQHDDVCAGGVPVERVDMDVTGHAGLQLWGASVRQKRLSCCGITGRDRAGSPGSGAALRAGDRRPIVATAGTTGTSTGSQTVPPEWWMEGAI